MQYQIQTAPIWDSYKGGGCPLCALFAAREARFVGQYLSDNVMDPDFRQASNAVGFCPDHIRMMYAGQNKLGLALQLETRAAELDKLIKSAPADKKAAKKMHEHIEAHRGCVICSALDELMPRYYMTVAQMYGAEAEFPALFEAVSHCVKHASLLYPVAEYAGKKAAAYLATLTAGLKRDLKRTEAELREFADCFDFKSSSRPDAEAVPRAIKLLITDRLK